MIYTRTSRKFVSRLDKFYSPLENFSLFSLFGSILFNSFENTRDSPPLAVGRYSLNIRTDALKHSRVRQRREKIEPVSPLSVSANICVAFVVCRSKSFRKIFKRPSSRHVRTFTHAFSGPITVSGVINCGRITLPGEDTI